MLELEKMLLPDERTKKVWGGCKPPLQIPLYILCQTSKLRMTLRPIGVHPCSENPGYAYGFKWQCSNNFHFLKLCNRNRQPLLEQPKFSNGANAHTKKVQ